PTHFRLATTNHILELIIKLRGPHQGLRGRRRAAHLKLLERCIVRLSMQILGLQNHSVAVKHKRFQSRPTPQRTAPGLSSSPNPETRNSSPREAIPKRNSRCETWLERAR
ncbi:hypothetical protein KC19_4G190300, partial [Ceratodon purpureus]